MVHDARRTIAELLAGADCDGPHAAAPHVKQKCPLPSSIRERTVSSATTRRYQWRGQIPSSRLELPMPRARLLVLLAIAAALLVAPAARSASSDMVVSQVYAGGGNSGATYANDFVEVFNRGTTAIDLGTWSIQRRSVQRVRRRTRPAPATLRSRAGRSRSCGARRRSRAARRPGAVPAMPPSRIWSDTAPPRTTRAQTPHRR